MEIAILALLIACVIGLVILIILSFKKKENVSAPQDYSKDIELLKAKTESQVNEIGKSLRDDISKLKDEVNHQMDDINAKFANFKEGSSKSIADSYTKLLDSVDNRLGEINKKLEEKLSKGFENNVSSLKEVSEALGKITQAQANLDNLNESVNALNNVLNNSQQRGRFGEVVLEGILHDVFGDVHGCYDTQYELKNKDEKVRPDAVIFLPEPDKLLCIDSKFSFEPYLKIFDENTPKSERDIAKKELKGALVSQVNKIAHDYIIKDETSRYALMFIPNDGFYAFIQNDDELYEAVITLARKKNVVICSPSTLQPIVANLQALKINFEISKNIGNIIKEINILGEEFARFADRWTKLDNQYETANKTRKELNTTIDKITRKSNDIVNEAAKKKLIEEVEE
ncbi:MAG: DNA recombination protein RmuC [Bacilli bacterium]|nr:DNA recombination protein RmuC [Bacilli bacterium]